MIAGREIGGLGCWSAVGQNRSPEFLLHTGRSIGMVFPKPTVNLSGFNSPPLGALTFAVVLGVYTSWLAARFFIRGHRFLLIFFETDAGALIHGGLRIHSRVLPKLNFQLGKWQAKGTGPTFSRLNRPGVCPSSGGDNIALHQIRSLRTLAKLREEVV